MADMAEHREKRMSDEGILDAAHAENGFVLQSTELVL
jgi:hypothetical protein